MLYRPEEIHLKQRTTTCRNITYVTCLLFLSNAPEYLFSRWILLIYCIFIPKTTPSIGILDGGVYDVALHEPHASHIGEDFGQGITCRFPATYAVPLCAFKGRKRKSLCGIDNRWVDHTQKWTLWIYKLPVKIQHQ